MNSFLHKLLITNAQILRLRKAFVNGSSANIKLLKTQLHIMGQSEGLLGRPLGPLLKTGLPLMKNVLKPLAKSVLIPLGLTATASATDEVIQKKIFWSGMTTFIISNEEMNEIIRIVKSFRESALLIKSGSEATKNKAKQQRDEFLGMLLDTLSASLLGNLLEVKE